MLLYKIGMKSHIPEDYGNDSSKEESFMERTYAPLIRQFSSIRGCQTAYTLIYALDASEGGCRLTLDRKGEREQQASLFVPLCPEEGYRLLQYLCENAVQPEIWGDVIADQLPALLAAQKGGTAGAR